MNMKKLILLLALISNITFAKEGFVDQYWTDGAGDEKAAESANLDSISHFINNVTESELDALDSVNFPIEKAEGKPKWYFGGAQTSLALGFSGKIGVLTFGGTKSLEVNWERKKPEALKDKSETEGESSNVETITVNEGTTKADLQKEIEPFIRSMVDSKKVTDENNLRKNLKEVSGNFLAYAKGMNAAQTRYKFVPVKIRLEFNIEGSGTIHTAIPVLTGKVTVPVKLRLEFIRVMPKDGAAPKSDEKNLFSSDMTETEKNIATQTKSLMDKLAEEVTLAYSEEVKDGDMEKRGVELKFIEVGLGMGVEGKIGVASFKANVIPSVFFGRQASNATGRVPLLDKSVDEQPILVLMDESSSDKGLMDRAMNLERKRVRKGMKKAIDFAYKFAEKIQRKAESKKESNWKFKDMESRFHFSLAGTVGPVKLLGLPHFILHIANIAK